MRNYRTGIKSTLILVLFFISPAQANLQSELNDMFGSMVSATSPTAYQGQRRGVFSGGRLTVKNKISNPRLVSFIPPSFNAGCGGIDFFSGAFSFISMDQLVALLRGIAASSVSYAFQIALGAICKDCQEVMNALQKKIAEMTRFLGNSCKMGKYLVDTALSPSAKNESQDSLISLKEIGGGIGDWMESFTSSDGKTPVDTAEETPGIKDEVNKVIKGNLVWRALKKNGASSWFGSGDDQLLRALMTISGTIVIGDAAVSADGGKAYPPSVVPSRLTVKEFLDGGKEDAYGNPTTVTIYSCSDGTDEDACLNPVEQDESFDGFRKKLEDLLTGPNGLVIKLATNTGSLDEDEKAFMQRAPTTVTAMLRNLARRDGGMALMFAEEVLPTLALDMVQLMVFDMISSVSQAAQLTEHVYASELYAQIKDARDQVHNEYMRVVSRYQSPQEMYSFYSHVIQGMDKTQLLDVPTALAR